MDKQPTAIISFGVLLGGMELNAFKISKLLHTSTEVILITKTGSKLDKEYKETCKELNIKRESIAFRSFFSFSLIFSIRRILKENNIKNVIFLGASEMRSLYFAFLGLDINLIIRHGMKKTTSKKDIFYVL